MQTFPQRLRQLSDADRQYFESQAERFEDASASERAIEEYLPPEGPCRLLLLVHCAKCEMEFQVGAGRDRQVEDYIARYPELRSDPSACLELLTWEYRLYRSAGANKEAFARRFPEVADAFLAAAAVIDPPKPWVPPPEYDVDPKPIGKGGWGVVYKATHRRLQRVEALKIVDPALAHIRGGRRIQAQIERLRNEIPIAARLNHPHIVHLYADGEMNGYPYFVMEYCPGGSLEDRLRKGPMAPEAAARLVGTLAYAVSAVHAFDLIHRDLKPSNVLFDKSDEPKIADFGLTLPMPEDGSAVEMGEIAGTPAYMAPEQSDPTIGKVRPTTDVFGLGAVLFACLHARAPFVSADADARTRSPEAYDAQVPRDLRAICGKCLHTNPAERYQSARELGEDLDRFLAGEPVSVRRPFLRVASHWIRRNRWPVIVTLVLALAAGVWAAMRHDADQQRLARARERAEQAEEIARVEKSRSEAEKLRADAQRQAARAARIESARQQARRGNWINAMPAYDALIAETEPDALRLRVERLTGYFALNSIAALTEELEALNQANLSELAPQVSLLHGAWLLCDVNRQEEGRKRVRSALGRRESLFSEADQFFADALAAERVGQSIASLRKAVEADPLHYLANSSLAVALAGVGDTAEALRQAKFARGIFPFSPAADFAEALVALVEDDRAGLKQKLAQAVDRLPADRRANVAGMEKFLLLVNELQRASTKLSSTDDELTLITELGRAAVLLGEIQAMSKLPNPEPLGLPVPTVCVFHRRLSEIASAYVELGSQVKLNLAGAESLPRLKALTDDYPDAVLLSMMASVKLGMAIAPINAGDISAGQSLLREAKSLSEQALGAPSLLPGSTIPYLTRCLGITADLGTLRFVPQAEAQYQNVRRNVRLVVLDGEKWPRLREDYIKMYVELTVAPLVRRQCGEWHLETAKGRDAFERRRRELAALGRMLLDDWAISEPSNPHIPRLREELAKWQKTSGLLETSKRSTQPE